MIEKVKTRRSKLDKIDRRILRDLQEDGRKTNVDLAKSAGISAPPCLRRVRSLEDSGIIKSYHAKIDNATLGFNVTVFAMVTLSTQAKSELEEFERVVGEIPQVREVYLLAGEIDYVIKVVAKDWDSYQELHTNHLTNAPFVVSVKSSLCIRTGKDAPGVPIDV